MEFDFIYRFANIVQICTTLIALAGYIPQMVKIYQSKSSGNMSVGSWTLWTVSSAGALFYASVQQLQTQQAGALLFSSMVGFTLVATMLVLVLKYQHETPVLA